MTIPADIFRTMKPQKYEALRSEIQNGDILLFSGPDLSSRFIQWGTKSLWSHVGFIIRLDHIDRVMLLESVENVGVHTVALSNTVYGNKKSLPPYRGKLLIARHADFTSVNMHQLKTMSEFAVDRLGSPYAVAEIIKIGMRIMFGMLFNIKMPQLLQADDEFICSEYVALCYRTIGIQIPWDGLGFIAPSDIANDPKINPVGVIQTISG